MSTKKLLEYDATETFKTLFNELMPYYGGEQNLYMTRVEEGYIADVDSWSGFLDQETIFDSAVPVGAVGGGVLYKMDNVGDAQTFCNDTVCTIVYSEYISLCFESTSKMTICELIELSGVGKRRRLLVERFVILSISR